MDVKNTLFYHKNWHNIWAEYSVNYPHFIGEPKSMPVKDHNYIREEPWTMTEVWVVRKESHTVWHFNGVHMTNHIQVALAPPTPTPVIQSRGQKSPHSGIFGSSLYMLRSRFHGFPEFPLFRNYNDNFQDFCIIFIYSCGLGILLKLLHLRCWWSFEDRTIQYMFKEWNLIRQ